MTEQVFNIFSAVGIFLTFLAAMASVFVSIISLRDSSKAAKRADYISSITAGRDKWSYSLRENASLYFTQISRLCKGKEKNIDEIYNELTRYHFSILLLLSPSQKLDVEIHNQMSAIRSKAMEIVKRCKEMKEKSSKDTELNEAIQHLKQSILNEHQSNVYDGICFLIEREWQRQKYEATEMWQKETHQSSIKASKNFLYGGIVLIILGSAILAVYFLFETFPKNFVLIVAVSQFIVAIFSLFELLLL